MSVWTVVVAAGSGLRFGGKKQLMEVGGVQVFLHSVKAASLVSDGIVVVVPKENVDVVNELVAGKDKVKGVVSGGSTRSESVRCGLNLVPEEIKILVVHDAVRPVASQKLFSRVVSEVQSGSEAVVPITPVVDSIRSRQGDQIDRENLVAIQTPQAFDAGLLRKAHLTGDDALDDASLVESVGGHISFIEGDVRNIKITFPSDLLIVEKFLNELREENERK